MLPEIKPNHEIGEEVYFMAENKIQHGKIITIYIEVKDQEIIPRVDIKYRIRSQTFDWISRVVCDKDFGRMIFHTKDQLIASIM